MSKVTAARTEASPDEQSSRGYDLCEELDKKLTQAKGVCGAMMHMNNIDAITGESLWALESLIEDAEKAFEELRDIYLERTPKEVQS
ncbi:MAG: hypothetical protein ACR2M4_09050 [Actinomycetota bacterium]